MKVTRPARGEFPEKSRHAKRILYAIRCILTATEANYQREIAALNKNNRADNSNVKRHSSLTRRWLRSRARKLAGAFVDWDWVEVAAAAPPAPPENMLYLNCR
jgi:hypothetical protein